MSSLRKLLIRILAPDWQENYKETTLKYKMVGLDRAELDLESFSNNEKVLEQMEAASAVMDEARRKEEEVL